MTAYVIFLHESTSDPAEFGTYVSLVRSTFVGHPLTMLALDGAHEALEGPDLEGIALTNFPSMADAKAWYDSDAYQAVAQHRFASSVFRVLLVEGLG